LRRGEKPHFPTKGKTFNNKIRINSVVVVVNTLYLIFTAERQAKELVTKYEDLKKSGKLQKHIEKKRKKSTNKERKKFPMLQE
jgi:hypothetical protein